MCYDDGCDCDGCDGGCDGGLLAAIIAGSALLLLLVIGGIVALALIPVYIGSGSSATTVNPSTTLTGPTGRITASTFGQNQGLFTAGSNTGEIFLWDLVNGGRRQFTTQGQTSPITGLRSIGNQIVSSSSDGNLRIWDANTGTEARQALNLNGNGALNAIELGPNNQIFAGSENGQISVLSNVNGANTATALPADAANPVRFLGRLNSGQIVAGSPNSLRVYNVNPNTNALTLSQAINNLNNINNMIVTSDRIISSSGNSLLVHNPVDGSLVRTIPTTAPVQSITQTADGNIVTSENNVIRTYNLATGALVNSVTNPNTVTNLNARNNEIFAGNSVGSINRFTNVVGRNINPKMLAIISPAKAA